MRIFNICFKDFETRTRVQIASSSIGTAILLIILLGTVFLVLAQQGHHLGFVNIVAKEIKPSLLDTNLAIASALLMANSIVLYRLVRSHIKYHQSINKFRQQNKVKAESQFYTQQEMISYLGKEYYDQVEPLGEGLFNYHYRVKNIFLPETEEIVEVLVIRIADNNRFYFCKQNTRANFLYDEYLGCTSQDRLEEMVQQSYKDNVPPNLQAQQYWNYELNYKGTIYYVVAYLEAGQPKQHYFTAESDHKLHIDGLGQWQNAQEEFAQHNQYTALEVSKYANANELKNLQAVKLDQDEYWTYEVQTQGLPIFALLIQNESKQGPQAFYFTTQKNRDNYIEKLDTYINKTEYLALLKAHPDYPTTLGPNCYWTTELASGRKYVLSTHLTDRFFNNAEERQKEIDALLSQGYQNLNYLLECIGNEKKFLKQIQEDLDILSHSQKEEFITYDIPVWDGTTAFTLLYNQKSWLKHKLVTTVSAKQFESDEARETFVQHELINRRDLSILRDTAMGVPEGMKGTCGAIKIHNLHKIDKGQAVTLDISRYGRTYFAWIYKHSKGELKLDYTSISSEKRLLTLLQNHLNHSSSL